jgi:CheY-like chemotaxis protein
VCDSVRGYVALTMLRVLVATDPRMYREVIAGAVRRHRPRAAEVLTAEPENLDSETRHLAPHLVVCNRAMRAVREVAVTWVELEVRLGPGSLDANVKVDNRPLTRVEQAEIDDVLAALDETERAL